MTSPELERLALIGQLKREPGAQAEIDQRRNALEYEGYLEVDERLLADLLQAAEAVYEAMDRLGPVPG